MIVEKGIKLPPQVKVFCGRLSCLNFKATRSTLPQSEKYRSDYAADNNETGDILFCEGAKSFLKSTGRKCREGAPQSIEAAAIPRLLRLPQH